MEWKNTKTNFGIVAKLFHWTSAAAFIGTYLVVYYVIWFMDDTSPESLPVLNVHWVLGILVASLVVPRLVWRLLNVQPDDTSTSKAEHLLARASHWGLLTLMIVMPLTGYVGTDAPTNFGPFVVPSFRETTLFAWVSSISGISWEAFELPVDAAHHFIGKWIAWLAVSLHVIAALFHHSIRRDKILVRMLPRRLRVPPQPN